MRFDPLKNWDDEQKAAAVKILGFCVAAVTLFILIATVSYLFHWRQDMSLLNDPAMMDASQKVANAAGKLGYRTGHFLVGDCFGLGSFALLVILGALSVRLILHRWVKSLTRTTVLALLGASVSSLVLAYIGVLIGAENAFGGGL